MQILSPTEAGEEEDFEPYISEDREVEAACNRKTAQRIQMAILQDLHQESGATATLPENAAKDLILQVIIIYNYLQSIATLSNRLPNIHYLHPETP